MRVVHWFRRDLRVRDNTALFAACARATDGVVGLFIVSPGEWRAHDDAPVKVDFWRRNLAELAAALAKLNIPLIVVRAETGADVPVAALRVARHVQADALSFNIEYEVDEARRDDRARCAFEADGRQVIACHDRCILPPGTVRTNTGGVDTVFTPFMNQFVQTLAETDTSPGGAPKKQKPIEIPSTPIPSAIEGFHSPVDPTLWPAGEKEAGTRLARFIDARAVKYEDSRDVPGTDGTSTLSPFLAAGVISPRECLHRAITADGGIVRLGKSYAGKATGVGKWVSELIWREFYIHLSHLKPRVCMGAAFKPVDRRIPWRHDERDFAAWREGRTGFPIVDAGMRQLRETGWMHNRVRMITAMFLTKDLLIDWRWGERHFMRHLVDGDLASNNGGWQWSASTGTDAAPYFRVYNPTSQAERCDPRGAYIRRWVPELAHVEGDAIFDPSRLPPLIRGTAAYPAPIVDHGEARSRVLEVFRGAGASPAGSERGLRGAGGARGDGSV